MCRLGCSARSQRAWVALVGTVSALRDANARLESSLNRCEHGCESLLSRVQGRGCEGEPLV